MPPIVTKLCGAANDAMCHSRHSRRRKILVGYSGHCSIKSPDCLSWINARSHFRGRALAADAAGGGRRAAIANTPALTLETFMLATADASIRHRDRRRRDSSGECEEQPHGLNVVSFHCRDLILHSMPGAVAVHHINRDITLSLPSTEVIGQAS